MLSALEGALVAAGLIWGGLKLLAGKKEKQAAIGTVGFEEQETDNNTTPAPTPTPTPSGGSGNGQGPSDGGSSPGPQAVTWDVALWGGGGQPMKWAAVRTALYTLGYDVALNTVDINGANCPTPGVGSRSGCKRNPVVSQFQSEYNKMVGITKINPTPDLIEFDRRAAIAVDGLMGANSLNALARSLAWQNKHGGILGRGNFRNKANGE